jgi:pimeloyl-ACP methyl ester carboxylesterase
MMGIRRAKEDLVGDYTYPEFRWLERGEGEPVLLLHGLMGRMDDWDDALDLLALSCRPMAPLLPIFHPGLPATSLAALADHVVGLLDALDIPHAVIGGNSLGGHVALTLALARPERVSGLILTGSSGLFERGFTRGVPHRPNAEYVREKMEEIFYDSTLVTPDWVETVRRTVTDPATALRVVRFARAAKRENLEGRLHEIQAPTLIVWGRDDRITPPEVAERFHGLIPDSRLAFLPRCGHAPMIEQPAAFSLSVQAWLEATRPRRARAMAGAGGLR